nr:unnamed protein product [Callosobruchus analis]
MANKQLKQAEVLRQKCIDRISDLAEFSNQAESDVTKHIQFKMHFRQLANIQSEFETHHDVIPTHLASQDDADFDTERRVSKEFDFDVSNIQAIHYTLFEKSNHNQAAPQNAGSTTCNVLLSTAIINILNSQNKYETIRILIDSGSQSNYISLNCAKRLGLPRFDTSLSIEGLNNMHEVTTYGGVSCTIKPLRGQTPLITLDAFILPKICPKTPTAPILSYKQWSHISTFR